MRKRRSLPVFVERTIAETKVLRTEVSTAFEQQVRDKAGEERDSITCKIGCAHCCYRPVYLTILEGILIYQNLAGRGLWAPSLRKRLEEHAKMTLGLDPRVWLLSILPCPLLDKNRCLAYTDRPALCRNTFSTASPEYCHPHLLSNSGQVPLTEVMVQFHEAEKVLLKRHGLRSILMPLSRALLLGERVATGEEDIESTLLLLARDYFHDGDPDV